MKYTFCITQQCNLACEYCYIGKRKARMSLAVAKQIVDFMYRHTPPKEKIDVGFFGGEPLLEFERIKAITQLIEAHPAFAPDRVELTIVTNGTIFSDAIAEFIKAHNVTFGISCDGPASVHDRFRRFLNGSGSSALVERHIKQALAVFPNLMVNAVYHPQTLQFLPQVVDYFAALGLRQIYLNPDFSAAWTQTEADLLPEIYDQIGKKYVDYYRRRDPLFISMIDSKIIVILRGGYRPLERCRMGRGEYAFTPNGNIFPCERLIGSGENHEHCIGNIVDGLQLGNMAHRMMPAGDQSQRACSACSLKEYCMTWCGCSNYLATGYYDRVSPFLCATERAAIQTAFTVFQTLETELGPTFFEHLAGLPFAGSVKRL